MHWRKYLVVTTIVWSALIGLLNSAWAQPDEAYYRRIAARAAGEASFSEEAFAAVVCTMKNRLEAGWTRENVLEPYFAPDVEPTNDQVAIAWEVLRGHRYCDPQFYYSLGFIDNWTPGTELAGVIQAPDGSKGIRLYSQN